MAQTLDPGARDLQSDRWDRSLPAPPAVPADPQGQSRQPDPGGHRAPDHQQGRLDPQDPALREPPSNLGNQTSIPRRESRR
jgi:hypothetical protein